jgi:hypothetical protein
MQIYIPQRSKSPIDSITSVAGAMMEAIGISLHDSQRLEKTERTHSALFALHTCGEGQVSRRGNRGQPGMLTSSAVV